MRFRILNVLLFIILTLFTSCDPEYHSVGSNLLIDQAFETDLYKAPVYTYQNKLIIISFWSRSNIMKISIPQRYNCLENIITH